MTDVEHHRHEARKAKGAILAILSREGADAETIGEMAQTLEAVRAAAYAEGRATAKLEQVLARERMATTYVSRTPLTMTKTIVLDYLKSVSPRPIGAPEIIKNTARTLGYRLSYTTTRRALDLLTQEGQINLTDRCRWAYSSAATSSQPQG